MTNQNDRIAKLEAAIAELQEMVNVCEMDRNRALAELARLRPLAELYPLAWEEIQANSPAARNSAEQVYAAMYKHRQARAERGVGQ
jgi:hypothetical protein